MAHSLCSGCGNVFTGVGPFDAHQKAIDERPFSKCLDPASVGLKEKDGKWGGAEEFGNYTPAAERPDADYIVECRDCGKEFKRPRTRGRPPVRCPDCKAK